MLHDVPTIHEFIVGWGKLQYQTIAFRETKSKYNIFKGQGLIISTTK